MFDWGVGFVDGIVDGSVVGWMEGDAVVLGWKDAVMVGDIVGNVDGWYVGWMVGDLVGDAVGDIVGCNVG